jgi:predicted DNA-binding transcriptional regulator YafY
MLKEHSNGWISGWYLLGIVIDNAFPDKIHLKIKNIRLFSLNRINDAVTLNYKPEVIFERRFNPSDFFKYTIGLFRVNLLQIVTHKKVIIETTGAPTSWIYDYIKAYPIHSTQTVIDDKKEDKYMKFSLMVEENPELEQFLMKYSNEIRVVSPVELKTKIKKRLEVALGHYE